MTRLFIEDLELDLTEGLGNLITYSIDDLTRIDSKTTSYSKTLVIPGTANNNYLLGNIFELNNSNDTVDGLPNVKYNFNAAKSAKCRIEVNGLQIVKGVFRLLKIINDNGGVEYESSIVGELGGFAAALSNYKLSDLDFSAYDHTYTISAVTNSWDNYNGGSGIYYPMIDYGNYSTDKVNWKLTTFRPALFVKEYLEKIVNAAGYTMDFPLAETDRFKRLIIPYNKAILTNNNTEIFNKSVEGGTIFDFTSASIEYDVSGGTLGAFTTSDYKSFTYSGSTIVSTNVTLIVFIDAYSEFPDQLIITFKKNGAAVVTKATTHVGRNDLSIDNFQISPGDVLRVDISSIRLGYTVEYTSDFIINSSISIPTPILKDDAVDMNDTLPQNYLQKDFFASILKLFNLMVTEDKWIDKHLVISPYVDFYQTSDFEDWSDKVDYSKPVTIKPMSEINARFYKFRYKPDTDYWNELYKKRYNESYGDITFDNNFEFTNESQDLELIFSPTVLVKYTGNDKVYSTILKQTGNAPSVVEENVDSNIRIIQAKKMTCTSYSIYDVDSNGDVVGTLYTGTNYGYAGHVDDPVTIANDLNFGALKEVFFTYTSAEFTVNQFNVYYSPYMAEITNKDSRLLTVFLKLTEVDIFNLDFSRLKYINGGLYRLYSVNDYDAGQSDTVQCELLRVVNLIY